MSKNKSITIAIFVIFLMTASMIAVELPKTAAQSTSYSGVTQIGTSPSNTPGYPNLGPLPAGVTPAYTFTSEAYLSFSPNPIGVKQALLVNMWTSPGVRHSFYMQGYTVTIQKPDGTTETVGPFNSYVADSTAWFTFVPDQVGQYKFKFNSPGTYIPAGQYWDQPGSLTGGFGASSQYYNLGASVYYSPSSTDWQTLTVQQDMVAAWPGSPLPTDYWLRPISPENREWYSISGGFPWTGAVYYDNGRVLYGQDRYKYTAYVQAPNTAHVLWRRQGNLGGLLGGDAYTYSMTGGGGTPSIIFQGRCYQTITKQVPTIVNGSLILWPSTVWECYDLRTGQVYWDIQGVATPTNILYDNSGAASVPGEEAATGYTPYLVGISGGRLYKYNPYTGAATVNISLPSYITAGTIFNNDRVLSIQTIGSGASATYRLINWTMFGSSLDFNSRIGTNITWPRNSLGQVDYNAGIAVQLTRSNSGSSDMEMQWCVGVMMNATDLYTGQILWSTVTNDTLQTLQMGGGGFVNRGIVAYASYGQVWKGFNARTGSPAWTSDKTTYPWGAWWAYNMASYDINSTTSEIIGTSYDGVWAFDWSTGKALWHFQAGAVPFEEPYSDQPFFTGVQIADGKVYAFSGEHTPSQPITRGWSLFCIDAVTGQGLWNITGPMAPGAIADGYLTASNTYDGYMYVFGKGQSATTMSTPDTAVTTGTEVVLKGSVMDMSPGDQGSIQNPTARLDSPTKPGTVPCVNAASMKTQMEYLYMQKPLDGMYHNVTMTGVPVILTAIDSSNNVIDIGKTTTNAYDGTFGMAWTPPKAETYYMTASFAGDGSYGSSMAGSTLVVSAAAATATPAPSVTNAPTNAATTNDLMMYMVGGVVAIIIAILLVGAILYRKH